MITTAMITEETPNQVPTKQIAPNDGGETQTRLLRSRHATHRAGGAARIGDKAPRSLTRARVARGLATALATAAMLGACSGSSPTTSGATRTSTSGSAAPSSDSATSAPADSSTTSATHAGSSGTACTLVTEQDATIALGSPSGQGQLTGQGSSSRCTYSAGGGSLIVITDQQGKTPYDRGRASLVKDAPAGSWNDLSGIGDAALISHGGPLASVAFYKGPTFVSIILRLSRSTTTGPSDAAVTLAKTVADRI